MTTVLLRQLTHTKQRDDCGPATERLEPNTLVWLLPRRGETTCCVKQVLTKATGSGLDLQTDVKTGSLCATGRGFG